ncbi:hypothetical protein MettiDRAFT_2983 [Methanolobus tindarius DSM 2278]|uniref:Uncharacterized protein n=1 Tax=Methanolobus tindarius DSM 2278 TaxID=1090322 RepID=W9E1J2_METTI|nr:hypothetical protein [Methanolobus tindarius]ETA69481.1 hypothetical protein MettiDRAFT_2983 [Methanolobus tindarius DSM 2278]
MAEEQKSDQKVVGGSGITAGGNVSFGNVSGQVAIGENIEQTQTLTLSVSDKKELLDSLVQFRNAIANLGLPEDELDDINNDVGTAVKEAQKDEPNYPKIKRKFEGVIETIKEVGDTIDQVSKWEWTGKVVKLLGKLGFTVLL